MNSSRKRPSIGVSSCLMGEQVRFDGNHKRNTFIVDQLKNRVDFISLCPEVAIGMGVPRQPIRLVKHENSVRAVGVRDNSLDVTEKLKQLADEMTPLSGTLSGYIFKKNSPSCGVFRVKIYNTSGFSGETGSGVFSSQVLSRYPNLPVEEEGRLNDPELRDNFLKRVFIYYNWQTRMSTEVTCKSFEDFHRIHKFTLLAHDQGCYRKLGKLVAGCTQKDLKERSESYITQFMSALKNIPTVSQNINVIMHIMGFLKNDLTSCDKKELVRAMDKYRIGDVSREVPLTLISHHLKNHPNQYLASQHYLSHDMLI